MKEQRTFAVQSFLLVLIINGLLFGAIYYFYLMPQMPTLQVPLAAQYGLDALTFFAIVGGVGSLLLWLLLLAVGRGQIAGAAAAARAQAAQESRPSTPPITAPSPRPEPAPKPAPAPAKPSPVAAVQILSALQRKGRLIDFLQEDLSLYEDAQIGAAVRNIHAGCKQALDEHVDLAPVYQEPEGSNVTVEPGFDARAVQLSGDVSGNPPFRGTLVHRGWRVTRIELPEQTMARDAEDEMILAAAEVEVGAR